jgi:NADPH:quinone reductase-like Zn-dependent oxidoreductase
VRPGGSLVTIAEPPRVRPVDAEAIFFVVESDRRQLGELERRLRDGRLRPAVGAVFQLADAPSAFDPANRTHGKTVISLVGR